MQAEFVIQTQGPGLTEFTDDVRAFVKAAGIETGLLTLFVRHTSCSILIQENADPDLQCDLQAFFTRLVPPAVDPSMDWAMMPVSISIPITGGHLALGTW